MNKLTFLAGTSLALVLGAASFSPAIAEHPHNLIIGQANTNMGTTEAMVVAGIVTDIYNDVVTIKMADGKEAKLKIAPIEQKRLGIVKDSPISAVVTEGENDVWVAQEVKLLDSADAITSATSTTRTITETTETVETTAPVRTTTTTTPVETTTTTTTTETSEPVRALW